MITMFKLYENNVSVNTAFFEDMIITITKEKKGKDKEKILDNIITFVSENVINYSHMINNIHTVFEYFVDNLGYFSNKDEKLKKKKYNAVKIMLDNGADKQLKNHSLALQATIVLGLNEIFFLLLDYGADLYTPYDQSNKDLLILIHKWIFNWLPSDISKSGEMKYYIEILLKIKTEYPEIWKRYHTIKLKSKYKI